MTAPKTLTPLLALVAAYARWADADREAPEAARRRLNRSEEQADPDETPPPTERRKTVTP